MTRYVMNVERYDYLTPRSSETDNLSLPLARLRANTFLPFFVAIRDLNPCLLDLFLLDG